MEIHRLRAKPTGVCKLTGERGYFVKSHLIPRAFTRPSSTGKPLIQTASGARPSRHWDSWYDERLVTRKGEDILAALDDWAVRELRRAWLVWSGWGTATDLGQRHTRLGETHIGLRAVQGFDQKKLRLFLLSLLWRAAITDRFEFDEINLPTEDIERIKRILIKEEPDDCLFYPVSLAQLSTRGHHHNQSPLAQEITEPSLEMLPEKKIAIFRFYFDGLIVYFRRPPFAKKELEAVGDLLIGVGDKFVVTTVMYENSAQRENLELVIRETLWR